MNKACDRQVQFGARCREEATANGRCAEHQQGNAPRALEPDVILVKFKLFGAALHSAAGLFRYVPRMGEIIEASHEAVAKTVGLQFKGLRQTDKGSGDSGTAVFGKQGLKGVSLTQLKLEDAGFALADIHTFEKPDGSGMLVLGYYKYHTDVKPVALRKDQKAFIDRSLSMNWGNCHVWANIPQYTAEVQGVRFRFLITEDRGDKLLIQVTRPKMDEVAEVSKKEIGAYRLETIHTVNLYGHADRDFMLHYAEGLWDVEEVPVSHKIAETINRMERGNWPERERR